jgi:hypothetical protein
MQDKWTIANDTWTWKQFRGTAESVYRLMRVPFDNRAFVTMCARGSPDLDRAQPLAWRYKAILQAATKRSRTEHLRLSRVAAWKICGVSRRALRSVAYSGVPCQQTRAQQSV